MLSDSVTFGLLQNAMNASSLRQSVYANNIANANTPGYKREDVQFESLFQNEIAPVQTAQLGEKSIPITPSNAQSLLDVKPMVVQSSGTTIDNNGNNVDVNAEMSDMAQNQIRYNALVQDMSMRFTRMTDAIRGV